MEKNIELGSEFYLDVNKLTLVKDNVISLFDSQNAIWFDYGRSAIRAVPTQQGKRILLPEYICESVINCFPNSDVDFYKVEDNFEINLDSLKGRLGPDIGTVFVAHYFGYRQNEGTLRTIRKLADEYNFIFIEDITQSLFSVRKYYGDYVVASIRKWLASPQGGLCYINKKISNDKLLYSVSTDNARIVPMILKDLYIKELFDTNAIYRELFKNSEEIVDETFIPHRISDLAKFILKCIDVNDLKEGRMSNAKYLLNGMRKLGINPVRDFDEADVPLAIPLRVKNRDDFRSYLMENRVYCAVHWPFDGTQREKRSGAIMNSESLISIPIDQRYGKRELDYLLKVISRYGGDLLL